MGYYPDPDDERIELLEALRDVVLSTGHQPLSANDFAQILAQCETYEGLLKALLAYYRGEPW